MGCWEFLRIEPTTNKRDIKVSYAKLLKCYNPEEDATGYQELREAYTAALNYADQQSIDDSSITEERFANHETGDTKNHNEFHKVEINAMYTPGTAVWRPEPSPSQMAEKIMQTVLSDGEVAAIQLFNSTVKDAKFSGLDDAYELEGALVIQLYKQPLIPQILAETIQSYYGWVSYDNRFRRDAQYAYYYEPVVRLILSRQSLNKRLNKYCSEHKQFSQVRDVFYADFDESNMQTIVASVKSSEAADRIILELENHAKWNSREAWYICPIATAHIEWWRNNARKPEPVKKKYIPPKVGKPKPLWFSILKWYLIIAVFGGVISAITDLKKGPSSQYYTIEDLTKRSLEDLTRKLKGQRETLPPIHSKTTSIKGGMAKPDSQKLNIKLYDSNDLPVLIEDPKILGYSETTGSLNSKKFRTKNLAISNKSLCFTHIKNNDYGKAILLCKQSLKKIKPHKKANALLVAKVHESIGLAYSETGLFKKAIAHYQNAVRFYKRADSRVGRIGLGYVFIGLSEVFGNQGKHNKKIGYASRAVTMFKNELGKSHPKTMFASKYLKGL